MNTSDTSDTSEAFDGYDAFVDYAAELTLLAGAANPLPALLSSHGAGPWLRTYARFHPHEPSYCTFLYEADASAMPLRVSLYRDAGAQPACHAVPGLGAAQVSLPSDDAALGTLKAVLARHAEPTIVRYRPGLRCTFRAAHPRAGTQAGAQAGKQYVKVFAERDTAPQLHAGMQALWQRRGELGFQVARPLECDHALHVASQAALPGTPLMHELLGAHGLEVAAAIARAAASLPPSSLVDVAPAQDDDSVARSEHYARSIAALLPAYAARVRALVSQLERLAAACGPARRLPIHGGLHASQWLRCGDGLGLVDFDRLGMGDPELDVATFVTELRYERLSTVPTAQLCRAFIDAYAERVPLDSRRIELYVAHKEVAKLMRLARQPRPDAPRRFARALERIERTEEIERAD